MGPKNLKFIVRYENDTTKNVIVHISKDQDEADGMIMAVRTGKAENPYCMLMGVSFAGVLGDEN